MNPLSLTLILAGAVLLTLGLAASGTLSPLGRLPGDITVQRPGLTVHLPLATSDS